MIHEVIASGSVVINGRTLTREDAEIPGRYDVRCLINDSAKSDAQIIANNAIDNVTIAEDALEKLARQIRVWCYIKPIGIDCNMVEKDKHSIVHVLREASLLPTTFSSVEQSKPITESSAASSGESRIFPIGRLDKDSCGMLLLTNSGALCERLLHPSFAHEKEYFVQIAAPPCDVPEQFYDTLRRGVSWTESSGKQNKKKRNREPEDNSGRGGEDDAMRVTMTTKPCTVIPVAADEHQVLRGRGHGARFRITLTQGLNRQIRKMVESAGKIILGKGQLATDDDRHVEIDGKKSGYFVTHLFRERIGPISINEIRNSDSYESGGNSYDIKVGDIVELTGDHLERLVKFAFQ